MSTPPAAAAQLRERARALDALERADIPWLHALEANEKERALADLKVVKVETGELLCRVGRPVTYWFGVIDGLLKMSNDTAMGIPITFTGLPPGGWFGEGTVIKREPYRYNMEALRPSTLILSKGFRNHGAAEARMAKTRKPSGAVKSTGGKPASARREGPSTSTRTTSRRRRSAHQPSRVKRVSCTRAIIRPCRGRARRAAWAPCGGSCRS